MEDQGEKEAMMKRMGTMRMEDQGERLGGGERRGQGRQGFPERLYSQGLRTACKDVPECNAEWRDDAIRLHKNVHVGVAMDLGSLGHSQAGLVVPVVRNVQLKGVSAISKAVKDYASRARPAGGG